MVRLAWDRVGGRTFETGVDHCVLYLPDNTGDYNSGVAWNGLTTVTESPSGAEASPQYADNIKYLNLVSAEEFTATVEAFTYPDEFAECDGTAEPVAGIQIGQQNRKLFGLSYRTRLGNDLEGPDYGYKIHVVYGGLAAPSEKAYGTINDSPEAITFSWEVSTTPVEVGEVDGTEYKPTASLIINSTKIDPADLAAIEDLLYGTVGQDPQLPQPGTLISMAGGAVQTVRMTGANAPTYNAATHVVTLPAVTGVQWQINGADAAPGAQPALAVGETAAVTAQPADGYVVAGDDDWTFDY